MGHILCCGCGNCAISGRDVGLRIAGEGAGVAVSAPPEVQATVANATATQANINIANLVNIATLQTSLIECLYPIIR